MYLIPGQPIAMMRPRFGSKVYDPQAALKRRLKFEISIQFNKPLITKSCHLDVSFYMLIPKSACARRRAQLEGAPHHSRPDLDNLLKLLLDVCNEIIYTDDALISSISAKKVWASQPRTEFTIREIS